MCAMCVMCGVVCHFRGKTHVVWGREIREFREFREDKEIKARTGKRENPLGSA